MTQRPPRHLWRITGLCAVAWACGGSPPPNHASSPVGVLTLQPDPIVSIGVVEGPREYELHNAVASIRLTDGRIVVANSGSSQLLYFDSTGHFVRSAGGRGGGPGEFKWLTGVYAYGPDSILAVDGAGNRISVFDTNGVFARLAPADSISGDSVFPADVWLYRRFWVRGALTPEQRRAARRVLDPMPLPEGHPAYRFAQLDADGNVWFREPPDPSVPHDVWTVVSPEGHATAVAHLPRQFEPHVIGARTILGRWRDENDVNFIRRYALGTTAESATPPAWLQGGPSASAHASTDSSAQAAALNSLKASLRQLVMAQESYYADHNTYTRWADSLHWELPEGISLDILAGDTRGWIGVATAEGLPRICAMAVGGSTPAGWPEGSVRCS
jgi:hypothetical protein